MTRMLAKHHHLPRLTKNCLAVSLHHHERQALPQEGGFKCGMGIISIQAGCDTVFLPIQLKVVLTAENSSERARTHLRRLRDRMRLGQLASDGLVLTIETAEDVEAFWRDIVQPHGVLNLQRYQYFYHMLLRGRVKGTFDCCQKGS